MQGGHGGLSGGGHRGRRRGLKRGRRRGLSRTEALRAQVVRDLRGADEPLNLNQNVSTPADLLAGILKDLRLNEGIEETRLRDAWLEVAGEFVAKRTKPMSLRQGVLTLQVLQPSMKFHLEQTRGQLLARLKKHLGAQTVRDVRLVIG